MKTAMQWIGVCLLLMVAPLGHAATQFSSADYDLYPADFNNDGRQDLLYIGKTPDKPSGIALADSSGNPQFGFQTWPSNYLNIPWSDGTYTAIVADFNGDGYSDVLLQRKTPGNHYLLLANTNPSIGPVGQILGISQTIGQTSFGIAWSADQHRLVAGNFNGVGGADLFFQATAKGGTNAIVLSDSSGIFNGNSSSNCWAGGPQQCWTDGFQGFQWSTKSSIVYAANFGGDAKADLLVQARPDIVLIDYDVPIPIPHFRSQAFGILLGQAIDGAGTIFRSTSDLWNWNERGGSWSPLNTNLVIGDFDGDGFADIFLQSKSGGRPNVLVKENASGTGQVQTAVSVASNVAGWSGNSYQLLSGRFGNSSSAVLYLQSTSASGSNYYTSNILGGSVSTTSSSLSVIPVQPVTPTAAGATAGAASVSATGGAGYSIPIQVPRGTANLTPQLALNYSQYGGNGLYGVGWGLSGLSIITRCTKTLAQDSVTQGVQLAVTDEYCVDGNRLRRVAGTQGQSGSQYRTELETYSLITANGTGTNGPSWFEVKRKDGLIYEYGDSGGTTDARIPVPGSATTRVWALSRIKDRAGNYIDFTYYNDTANGSYRPHTISYTGNTNSATAPAYTIEFFDEARNSGENLINYYMGGMVNQTRRINRIEVRYGTTVVRKYLLNYLAAPTASALSRLSSIQECGATNCLPATQFAWSDQQLNGLGLPALETTGRLAPQYAQLPSQVGFTASLDFNGDGVLDTLTVVAVPYSGTSTTTLSILLGARHGETAPAAMIYQARSPNDGILGPYDWDGDGKDDVVLQDSGTGTFWWVHQKSDGTIAYEDTGVASTLGGNTLMDVDGDGYKDIVRLDLSTSKVYVSFHRRDSTVGFETTETLAWTAPSGTTLAFPVVGGQTWYDKVTRSVLTNADVDGDGRQDLLVQVNNGWRVLYSTGGGFITGDLIVSKLQPANAGYTQPTALDVNGDGCTDFAYPSNVASSILQLAVSRCRQIGGVGLLTAVSTGISVAPNGFRAVVVDWNLDGYQDLMFEGKVVTSLGTTFATPIAEGSQPVDARADLDGDGIPDFVQYCNCSNQYYTSYAALGPKPNLMLSVTDGLGNKSSFTYAPLTDPSAYTRGTGGAGLNQDFSGAMYVVKQLSSTDGVGGTYALSYRYQQARRNIQGRGFLGFARRTITDSRTGMVTDETYDQSITASGANWENAGRLTSRKVYQYASGPIVQDATYTNSSFVPTDANSSRYPYVSQSQVKDYELNDGVNPVKTVTTTTSVDNYGTPFDVQTTVLEGLTGAFAGSSAILRTYTPTANIINNLANWCLSKPTQVQSIRSHTQTDGGPLTRTATQTWDTTYCRLTDTVVEPGAQQLTTHLDYDGFNNITKSTQSGSGLPGAGLVTETNWGTTGQLPQWTKNPKLQQTIFTWDYSLGLKLTEQDPNGRVVTNWYDDLGRMTRVKRPDGTSTRQSYFACNAAINYCGDSLLRLMVKTAERDYNDATDVSYRYTYLDTLGRKKYEEQLALNGGLSVVQTMYDPRGNIASQSLPYYANTGAYKGMSYTYDLLNRRTRADRPVSDADRTVQSESVTYNGLTVTRVDAGGGAQTEVSNAWGQIVRMIDQGGANTNYTYDVFGELKTATDPLGNVSSLTYTARGFKDSQTDPDLGGWIYTYDALGQMLTQRDAKMQTTSITYDELGRMKTRTDPGLPATTWMYDTAANGIGQLDFVNGPDGTGQLDASHFYRETNTYDSVGRRSTVTTQETAIGSYAVDYSYDSSIGTLKTITYPMSTSGRFAVQYSYQNGYLKDVREATAGTPLLWQALDQDASGRVIQESYGNNQQTYLNFDQTNGRLSYLQTGPSGGSATQNLVYQWDRLGNLSSRQDVNQSLTESFTYDTVNRLVDSRLNGALTQTMSYNAIGNITSKVTPAGTLTYGYPASGASSVRPHAVSTVGSTSYAYDANGNMTSRNGGTVVWTGYNYPQNINDIGGNYSTVYYAPDRSKYRQVAKTGATTEDRVYIGGMFEKMTSGSTTEYRHYIVASGKAVAVRMRVSSTEETYYLHEDHLGSTDAITNQAGAKLVQLSYAAWGDRRGSNWTGAPSSGDIAAISASTHRGFGKQEQLDNLGLVHLNGRVYDATIGRFMSADPIVQDPYHSQSFNRYSYVWNNPLNATDPTGFVKCTGSHIDYDMCVDWQTGNITASNDMRAAPLPVASDAGNSSAQAVAVPTVKVDSEADAKKGAGQSELQPDPESITDNVVGNGTLLNHHAIRTRDVGEDEKRISITVAYWAESVISPKVLERQIETAKHELNKQFKSPHDKRKYDVSVEFIAVEKSRAALWINQCGIFSCSGQAGHADVGGKQMELMDTSLNKQTFLHEFFHILGFGHAPAGSGSIRSYDEVRRVTYDDVQRLVEKYYSIEHTPQ
jgi:RHS repeat-associated protein